jgi:signal transduction histidine kinase
MVNLLSNAIKFTPPAGRVSIRIRKPSPREVQIGVADTGCGISKEDQDKIFDRFYTGGGFGLGLPITRQIVMAHGGKIWVESEPGKGSVFNFTLPWKIVKLDEKRTLVSTTVDHGNPLSDDSPESHRLSDEQRLKTSTD